MTDAGFLSLTPQLAAAHWGWTIAFFLWFIGLSGMLMALFYFVRDKRIALVSFVASILGCVFVLSADKRLKRRVFVLPHVLDRRRLHRLAVRCRRRYCLPCCCLSCRFRLVHHRLSARMDRY